MRLWTLAEEAQESSGHAPEVASLSAFAEAARAVLMDAAVAPKKSLTVRTGVLTVSEANVHDGLAVGERYQRSKAASREVTLLLGSEFARRGLPRPEGPVSVVFCRRGLRTLDDDNLDTALKTVRDATCARIGRDDGDPRLRFRYLQERCGDQDRGVTITLRWQFGVGA